MILRIIILLLSILIIASCAVSTSKDQSVKSPESTTTYDNHQKIKLPDGTTYKQAKEILTLVSSDGFLDEFKDKFPDFTHEITYELSYDVTYNANKTLNSNKSEMHVIFKVEYTGEIENIADVLKFGIEKLKQATEKYFSAPENQKPSSISIIKFNNILNDIRCGKDFKSSIPSRYHEHFTKNPNKTKYFGFPTVSYTNERPKDKRLHDLLGRKSTMLNYYHIKTQNGYKDEFIGYDFSFYLAHTTDKEKNNPGYFKKLTDHLNKYGSPLNKTPKIGNR